MMTLAKTTTMTTNVDNMIPMSLKHLETAASVAVEALDKENMKKNMMKKMIIMINVTATTLLWILEVILATTMTFSQPPVDSTTHGTLLPTSSAALVVEDLTKNIQYKQEIQK